MKCLQKGKIGLRHSFKQPLLLQTVMREYIGQVKVEDETKRTVGFCHNFYEAVRGELKAWPSHAAPLSASSPPPPLSAPAAVTTIS
jgi:hypothetical protein